MTPALRQPSARPQLVTDRRADWLIDPATATRLGQSGPFGRERVLFALPLGEPPFYFAAPLLVTDRSGVQLAATDGTVVGRGPVWVSRMLSARWVEDTRRLAG